MTTSVERSFDGLEERNGPATASEIDALSGMLGLSLPIDFRMMLQTQGWGSGWIPPLPPDDDGEDDIPSYYVVFFSPTEIAEWTKDRYHSNGFVFGSDGGGQLLAYLEGRGYGLCPAIGDPINDFMLVSKELEGFFYATENDGWFDE